MKLSPSEAAQFDLDESQLAFANQLIDMTEHGTSIQQVLDFLKKSGETPIGSIKILRAGFGFSMTDAKIAVHTSAAWRSERAGFDVLHDRAEEAAGYDGAQGE